jgi:hypothetical protein
MRSPRGAMLNLASKVSESTSANRSMRNKVCLVAKSAALPIPKRRNTIGACHRKIVDVG